MRREEHRTAQGDEPTSLSYIELSPEQFKLHGGIIRRITIPCSGNTSTRKYLAIYSDNTLVDVSTNALAQQEGVDSEWCFESLPKELPEANIKLVLTDTREGKQTNSTIHCYTKDDVADVTLVTYMDNDEIDFREIDIRRYWIPIVRRTAEFQSLADAINPELNELSRHIYNVLKEGFVLDSSEYGVERLETAYGLTYDETDTLDDRKARILSHKSLFQPYTWRTLQQLVETSLGDTEFELSYKNDKSELWIGVNTMDENKLARLKKLLSVILPQNIVPIYYSLIYDKCKNRSELLAVNADYKNHLDNGVWKHRLSSLTKTDNLFQDNLAITEFVVDLPKATNLYYTFYRASNFKRFKGKLPLVSNGAIAFRDTGLESFEVYEMPNLTNGQSMFHGTKITRFNTKVPKLYSAYLMFCESKLEAFESELLELVNADSMFYSTKLKSFNKAMPKCNRAPSMFRGSTVEEITITEHQITSLSTFVYFCYYLKKINMDMGNVTSLSYFGEGTPFEEFGWDLSNVINANNAFYRQAYATSGNKIPTTFDCELPKVKMGVSCFGERNKLTTCKYPIDINGECIYKTKLPQAVDENGDLKYAYLTLPELCHANNMFGGCQLDKPTILSILNSLREKEEGYKADQYTTANWQLTIGIHVDHKNDEEVLQAIANAEAKGWTLTVQWNGTPTSGIALLDMDFIYAKRTQNDEGGYIDENGTRWDVDWGHYVTGSDYIEYNSEEEALAGLTFCGSMLPEPEMEELTHE